MMDNNETVLITRYTRELELEVEYSYSIESGMDYFRDPSSAPELGDSEVVIHSVTHEGIDFMPVIERMNRFFDGKKGFIDPINLIIDELTFE